MFCMFRFFKRNRNLFDLKINITTKSLKTFLKSKGLRNLILCYDHYIATYTGNISDLVTGLSAKYVGNVDNEDSVFEFNYNGLICYMCCGDFINQDKIYIQTKPFKGLSKVE